MHKCSYKNKCILGSITEKSYCVFAVTSFFRTLSLAYYNIHIYTLAFFFVHFCNKLILKG